MIITLWNNGIGASGYVGIVKLTRKSQNRSVLQFSSNHLFYMGMLDKLLYRCIPSWL